MKLFENDSQVEEFVKGLESGAAVLGQRTVSAQKIEALLGEDTESLIAEARYGFIAGAVRETVTKEPVDRVDLSNKIDSVLTHRFWAYPVFLLFMWLLFQLTFLLGRYPQEWIDTLFGWMGALVSRNMADGVFRDLLVNGIIGGVGSVAVFLPNILLLFFGISIMEDTGYMARAAFIADKFMHSIGLHGKSFIPMLMGMGCSVPAILAARTLESERDRIKTILLVPLISCSARMPVYVLFAGTFFPRHAGNIVFLFQFVFGIAAFFLMGFLFKHTLFKGEENPFVMELPPYRLPTIRSVAIHMWQKAEHYLKKMGGVVLVFSMILWYMGAFPRTATIDGGFDQKRKAIESSPELTPEDKAQNLSMLESERQSKIMERTYIGRLGKVLEPVVRPLGFDWRGAVALVSGLVAKEVVVSSLGVLYAAGDNVSEHSSELRRELAGHFTPLTAFGFMMFVLLYTPCVVSLVTIIRELKKWYWSVFSVTYQCTFAWIAAFAVFQLGRLAGLE
jgi:ferrous iron transport protein B